MTEYKKLRSGYTTGSCAAAAAKAAAKMLFEKNILESVEISTPKWVLLNIKIHKPLITDDFTECYVIKDAGDDPDITNGIKIFARAQNNPKPEIKVLGGKGIGVVTKKGLSVEVGNPAINPVPMKMILDEVKSVMPENNGVIITISAPEGVELAEKTLNPKLGIIGGISILGTIGIVEPMSEEAFKDSLKLKLSVLKETGFDKCVFTPGNYGEKFLADNFCFNDDLIVVTSNFIGFMLDEALFYGMKKILMVGHIGKLVKIAGGIFHTHSKVADARNEIMAANYAYYKNDLSGLKKIMDSNTTEEAVDYIEDKSFFKYLVNRIKEKCEDYVHKELEVEAIIFSQKHGVLGETENARKLADELKSYE